MSHLDERLRSGLREAGGGAAAPDVGALTDEITRRRHHRDRVRRVQAGGLALGIVAVVAAILISLSRTEPAPTVLSTPSPTVVSPGQAVQITGVPFPVCHPMSIPGVFGSNIDTVWVFEKERVPGAGCVGSEGFQYVGVGSQDEVAILSEEIHDVGQDEHALWPFATPDIDGDGVDEIAIGIGGSLTEGYARVMLYRVATDGVAGTITPVVFDCGPACDPVPWIGIGTFVESLGGAYCGPEGFVRWSAGLGRVIGNVWSLEGDRLVMGPTAFDHSDVGSGYPPDGMQELCGGPTTWPEDLPSYPVEQTGSGASSPEPEPVAEGQDIGIGTNICSVQRLGGLDLLPGGDRDVAWTGYLVLDDGRCPERNWNNQQWIVAVDVTGDGLADAWTDIPLINCSSTSCWPLGATDLDGDGDGELVVSTSFSILDQGYFAISREGDGFAIAAINVAAPGHPAAGIEPSAPLETSAGGDAGYGAWIRCESYPDAPILVFTFVSSIVESNQPAEWHEVKLQLQADGLFHVIGTTDLSLPIGDDPGVIRSEDPACGLDFNVFAPPNPN